MRGPDQVRMQAKLIAGWPSSLALPDRVHWPGLIGGDVKWGALGLATPSSCHRIRRISESQWCEALSVGRPVLITYQVNIWQEIKADGVGLADEDTLEGIVRLLQAWFDLLPAERAAMAARAEPCFSSRFSMKQAAVAINRVFSSVDVKGANPEPVGYS